MEIKVEKEEKANKKQKGETDFGILLVNVFASGRFAPETNDSIVTSLRVAATLVRALVASSTALLRVFQYKQRSLSLIHI